MWGLKIQTSWAQAHSFIVNPHIPSTRSTDVGLVGIWVMTKIWIIRAVTDWWLPLEVYNLPLVWYLGWVIMS
jgi:hypothetical protein